MVLPSVAALVGGQSVEHSLVGSALQVHIERSVDAQAALKDAIVTVFILEIAADVFDEIWGERIRIVLQMKLDRLGARFNGLLRGEYAVLKHGIDHQIASPQGAVRMIDG